MSAIPNPKPRRRGLPTWVTLLVLALVLLGAAGLVYAAYRPERGIWVNELKADAQRSLPMGSSREQALEWFTSRGIEDVKEARDLDGTGYKAIIPNSSWVEGGEIIVTCMFDGKDQLSRLSVVRMRVNKNGDAGGVAAPQPDRSQPRQKPGRITEPGR